MTKSEQYAAENPGPFRAYLQGVWWFVKDERTGKAVSECIAQRASAERYALNLSKIRSQFLRLDIHP